MLMDIDTRRFLLVLVMILAFVSQSIAAVSVFCPMSFGDGHAEAMISMDGMDHSAHAMHDPADTDQSAVDCCEDGFCTMSNCVKLPSMGTTADVQDSPFYTGVLNVKYTISYLDPTLLSLFRPPISS